jgi:hypothetical protein
MRPLYLVAGLVIGMIAGVNHGQRELDKAHAQTESALAAFDSLHASFESALASGKECQAQEAKAIVIIHTYEATLAKSMNNTRRLLSFVNGGAQ